MPYTHYPRVYHPGGIYFFTVNLLEPTDIDWLIRYINILPETDGLPVTQHTAQYASAVAAYELTYFRHSKPK